MTDKKSEGFCPVEIFLPESQRDDGRDYPGFFRGHKDGGSGIVKVAMDLLFHTLSGSPEGIIGGEGGMHFRL
jgi:hypothetical protein